MTAQFELKFKIPSDVTPEEYIQEWVDKTKRIVTAKYTEDPCSPLYDKDFIISHIDIDFDNMYMFSETEVVIKITFYVETWHNQLDICVDKNSLFSVFLTDQQNNNTYTGWANILRSRSL